MTGEVPDAGKVVHFEVDDVDAALAAIVAAGGTALTGRMPIPERCRRAMLAR